MGRLYFYYILICDLVLSSGEPLGPSSYTSEAEGEKGQLVMDIRMPADVISEKREVYLCTATKVMTQDAVYIKGFDYEFNKQQVHHFQLYGCKKMSKFFIDTDYWPCNDLKRKGVICEGRKQIPLGLPSLHSKLSKTANFPSNVAYGIGPKFEINYLLLEIHYLGTKGGNRSGAQPAIKLHLTANQPKYYGGMLTMAAVGFQIPPHRQKFSVDVNCQARISASIYPYAYWVHTHDLGTLVSGYKVLRKTGDYTEIARWSHRLRQPVILTSEATENSTTTGLSINPGDFLAARCTYNSSSVNVTVPWGRSRKAHEMCNLFLFYFTLSPNPEDLSLSCVNQLSPEISKNIPEDRPLLPTTVLRGDESPICHLYRRFRIEKCPFG